MLSLSEIKTLTPGTTVTLKYVEMESDMELEMPAVVSKIGQKTITVYKNNEAAPTILHYEGYNFGPYGWRLYKS